jgi:IS6 family transposase
VRALVLQVRPQLSRSGRNDASAASASTQARPSAGYNATLRKSRSGCAAIRGLGPDHGAWMRPGRVGGNGGSIPVHRQARATDRLHAVRSAPCGSGLSFPSQSPEDDSDYPPSSTTIDKLASHPKAIRRVQCEQLLAKEVEHRTSKYLNVVTAADHGAPKCVIPPARGFQRMRTASATLKGFEVMRMIRWSHCGVTQPGATGEINLVNQLFGLAA